MRSSTRSDLTAAGPELFARTFALDVRALATFRVSVAAIVLVDLAGRARDLSVFYTENGILPSRACAELSAPLVRNAPSLSLHAIAGGAGWQAALFAVAAACACGLALGWRTRAMTIATWALLTSLHARMPLVLYRGDAVLRLMLFVAMWLPLGAHLSLDARRRSAPSASASEVGGAACFIAAAQLAIVYVVGVAYKSGVTWRDGSAVYYALQLDGYVTELGRWVGARPAWSPALTWGTLGIELAAPLLLFVPWQRDKLRVIAVALAFALHIGMLLTMRLDLFPWVMFACWGLFLPPPFWDAVARRAGLRSFTTAPGARVDAHDRRWAPVLLGVLAAIIAWNVTELSSSPPPWLGTALRPFGLTQRWSMFSPDPARDDGWLVARARLAGGEEVDVLDGGLPIRARPREKRDLRWRSYLALVARDPHGPLTSGLLAWLCARTPGIEQITLVFEEEYTMPPGVSPLRETLVIGRSTCHHDGSPADAARPAP
ncbi:MAG: HTTM domain-containing protein [Labilithrix sp.]